MTKKELQIVASIIRDHLVWADKDLPTRNNCRFHLIELTRSLAKQFETNSPTFDWDEFMVNCGITDSKV
jgi:hypothetical protein